MQRRIIINGVFAILGLAAAIGMAGAARAAEATEPEAAEWSFEGPFGTYDRGALQRGFQVYKEVCSLCHSLNRVAFRTLGDPGGPGFSENEIRVLAASYMVPSGPDERGRTTDANGNPLMREATPADFIPPPFPNEQAARAAYGGALPPDLSLIVKAREGGPNYLLALLTGYGQEPPAGIAVPAGKFYNPVFAAGTISMPQPLFEGQVTYADGTPATVEQMVRDVTTFLAWTAEPKMEERKATGMGVMAFLAMFAFLTFASYRRLWRGLH